MVIISFLGGPLTKYLGKQKALALIRGLQSSGRELNERLVHSFGPQ